MTEDDNGQKDKIVAEDHRKFRLEMDRTMIHAGHMSDRIERSAMQNARQIRQLCEVVYRDKSAADHILKSVNDGKDRSEAAAEKLAKAVEADPASLGKLRGNPLLGKDREAALAAAGHLGDAIRRRSDLMVTSDRYTVLWQKAHAGLKATPEKSYAVLEDVRNEREYCDATREGRLGGNLEQSIDAALEQFGARDRAGPQLERGREDDDTLSR